MRSILNNEYYKEEVAPLLDVERSLQAFVDLEVNSIGTFFEREQLLGEIRLAVRLKQTLEGAADMMEAEIREQTNKDHA